MTERPKISPAEGRLGILLPGMGAVATTTIAGVLLARKGLGTPIGSLTQMNTIRLADALAHFEDAEAKAGGTAPGPLASYFRGVTRFRLGRTEEAAETLEGFVAQSSGEDPLDWVGRALLAQIHTDSGNTERAIALLEEVTAPDSKYPVEQALVQLGIVQQTAGDRDAARKSWQRVVDEFAASASARQARELIGG